VLSVHYAKFVPVTSSVSLSESNSNTSSATSWSVMFSPCSPTAKCTAMKFGRKNPTGSDSVIQASECLACHMLLLQEGTDRSVHLKIDISVNLQFKKVMQSLQ